MFRYVLYCCMTLKYVCRSVCLHACLSACPVSLSACQPVGLSACLPDLSACLPVKLSAYRSVCLVISSCLSFWKLSVCLSVCLSACLFVCLSVCLFDFRELVCLFNTVCLSVGRAHCQLLACLLSFDACASAFLAVFRIVTTCDNCTQAYCPSCHPFQNK
jgi:hypothetical protein